MAVRQHHPRVERKVADIVRYHGGRRSRYRGQWRVPVQYLLTGLVVHVTRMVKRRRQQGAQPAGQPVYSSVCRGEVVAWGPRTARHRGPKACWGVDEEVCLVYLRLS